MKKLYIVALGIFVSGSMLAQPTIQYPDNAPAIGDVSYLQFVSPTGLSAGSSGANVSWDFSVLENDSTSLVTAVDPATTPAGGDYPGASVAFNQDDLVYSYSFIDNTGMYYMGAKVDTGSYSYQLIYSDHRQFLQYPFTFMNSFSDSYKGISSAAVAEVRVDGYSIVVADAYGTLTLPTGTYDDVLRISTLDTETDSIFVGGVFVMLNEVMRQQFLWYAPNSKSPLFSLESVTTNGVETACCFYSTAGSGIHAVENSSVSELNVYPIPASDHLFIEFQSSGNKAVTISIVNQVGQLVISREMPEQKPGLISEKININALPAGIYFANVSCKSGNQITEKFVKQ
ncbi:MAG: T9SS type A sorting domain-containing protein [Bacteroidales bacterium]|nr:T9SS type A sorting domain-containing protein [Bacteroidales bacterium]